MKTSIILLILAILGLYSCKSNPMVSGSITIHFDSSRPPSISKEQALSIDSCALRFLTDFNNDTIWIAPPNAPEIFVVASTNYSIAYATSVNIKKDLKREIKLMIDGNKFSFLLLKDFLFVDIYYNRKSNRLDIYYSNNILVLS